MYEQLQRIQQKLAQLKIQDSHLDLFGAKRHQYQLNPPVSLELIQQFEQRYGIHLPDEYVQFLMHIGNGGAGPFFRA
ncbi:SMI1/KNR4 family protein [Acinetobacter sp. R933-2]|uniref:SMI1/KNR4 family protein n=1 Tax=Acinetobacter sp. R933-2 TaxID=2746728 RepID=UPI002577FE04|nr:SMI1/KNR4 family protein [Acinetobacter sp. R933-2]MDM1245971.1 SMI1/KNR4 family protein [Acinetobacter sp. R933-2]